MKNHLSPSWLQLKRTGKFLKTKAKRKTEEPPQKSMAYGRRFTISKQQMHAGSATLHPNFAPFYCAKLRPFPGTLGEINHARMNYRCARRMNTMEI